jgi:hypothetical protein
MQQGDKVLIPAFFLNEVPVEGGATQANVQIAGGNNTIQIQLSRVIHSLHVVPATGVSIQSGDITVEFEAAVWGS